MRKRNYQETLEQKIAELEKLNKELNENNAGLGAENALLKKQLAYFEDIFAKSSLVGFENMGVGNNVSKSDLEEFQRSLLRKINCHFTDHNGNTHPSSDTLPSDDFEELQSSFQQSAMNQSAFKMLRNRSSGGGFGYLFLALVFCMMCCSSLVINSGQAGSSMQKPLSIPNTGRLLKSVDMPFQQQQ